MASMTRGVKSVGYGTGEPDAPDPAYPAHGAEQVAEILPAVQIAVDGLPQERDLRGPPCGQPLDFRYDVRQTAAPLRPARVRDNAEGALVIAAPLNRHEGGRAGFADRRDVLVMLPGTELGVMHPVAAARLADQFRQVAVGIRPRHEIHPGHPRKQVRPEPLRHAAHHAQHRSLALVPLELPYPADDALLRVIPHRAGVHQHHVGVLRALGADESLPAEEAEHELGIRHVHLAAVGFEVDALRHRLMRPVRA